MTALGAPSPITPLPAPARSVWGYVVFTGVVFGLGGLVAKGLIDDGVDAFVVAWMPFAIGGVLALANGLRLGRLTVAAVVPGVLLGLFASAVPAVMFNLGFEQLPAGLVTLLISLGPIVTAAVAHFAFPDERFNRVKTVGLVLALVGVAVLAGGSLSGGGDAGALVAVIFGAVVAGVTSVLARRFALAHGATALIAPQLLTGGMAALVAGRVLGRSGAPAAGWAWWHLPTLLGFGMSTYLGFLSMMRANEVGTTGQVSVIGYLVPLMGVIGGIAVFGDEPTVSLFVGGGLLLVAMAAIARGSTA